MVRDNVLNHSFYLRENSMRQDRFLIAILAGIGVLVVLSLAIYFARRGGLEYGPEDTPAGVVQNYVVALQRRDYERAYSYVANFENKPDLSRFTAPFVNYQDRDLSLTGLEITSTSIAADGQSALVYLVLMRGGNGPFDQGYRENNTADLVLEGGAWKIRSMAYPFWSYEWTQPAPAEAKPAP
jgi:hypothetical protein